MERFYKQSFFSLVLLCLIPMLGQAQISEDYFYNYYKGKYPKGSFVYLAAENEKTIDLVNGEPSINSFYLERLLCLNKNAYNVSKRNIGYDNFSTITELEAVAYIPHGKRYKKHKVKNFNDKEVITDGISFYSGDREKEFVFEDLKEGAVTEIKTSRKLNEPHLLGSHVFTRNIPIRKEIYRIKAHKDIEMGFHFENFSDSLIRYKNYQDGDFMVHEWTMENTDKLDIYGQERYNLHFEPHIIPYIKSYKIDGKLIPFMRNVEDLYKWYFYLIKQVDTKPNDEMKKLADELTEGVEDEEEKVRLIYNWVQSNIKYIAFGDGYGGFVPRDPKLVYKRRFGDCKDMSSILVSMLKSQGINAYFTWVGSRIMPYRYTDIATPSVDNHMIATYFLNDSVYYLDATHSNLKFGRGGYNTQGKQVLIAIDSSTFKVDSIRCLSPEESAEVDTANIKIADSKVIGSGTIKLNGYLAGEVYDDVKDKSPEKLEEYIDVYFEKGSNKYHTTSFDYNYDDKSKDLFTINYEFEIESYAKQFDDKTYLNLNLTKQLKDMAVSESQNVPLFFNFKHMIHKHYVLEIEKEMEVDYIPENISLNSPLMQYSINYFKEGNQLHYDLMFKQKVVKLQKEDFEEWNEGIKKLSKALNETITLKNTKSK